MVLSAAAGVRDVRPRGGAVPLCGGAAVRQGGSLRGSGGPVVGVAAAAAVRVSAGAVPCSARRGLCDTGGLRLPGCRPAARLRHLDTEERARTARSSRTEHVYGETRYAAGSWKQQRRVVIKAEVVRLAGREPRDNPRFVVTNLGRPPRSLYEKVYCARGDIENRIKELLDGLQIGPTRPVREGYGGLAARFERRHGWRRTGRRAPGVVGVRRPRNAIAMLLDPLLGTVPGTRSFYSPRTRRNPPSENATNLRVGGDAVNVPARAATVHIRGAPKSTGDSTPKGSEANRGADSDRGETCPFRGMPRKSREIWFGMGGGTGGQAAGPRCESCRLLAGLPNRGGGTGSRTWWRGRRLTSRRGT